MPCVAFEVAFVVFTVVPVEFVLLVLEVEFPPVAFADVAFEVALVMFNVVLVTVALEVKLPLVGIDVAFPFVTF